MLPALEAPEIFFGLCSPVGTDNKKVVQLIRDSLLPFSYKTTEFKVTDLMKKIVIPELELTPKPIDARYGSYIRYANKLRDLIGHPSALAMMCCGAVRAERRAVSKDPAAYIPNQAYVFDQFKRKEELEALRQVYGRLFIVISIYSNKEKRTKRLAEHIARDHASARPKLEHESAARALILQDEEEEGIPSGQRLRDAFPLADLFINIDDIEGAKRSLQRFVSLFFGANNISPTHDEYGIYIAKSAALRSLDLSRQVGAAIFSKQGEVVSLGCNEVPKPGGGTYWSDDQRDVRDYVLQRDENDRIKKALLADIVKRLAEAELFQTNHSADELVETALRFVETKGNPLRDSQLMDLIEFGRIIHAEMSAISDAARLGKATKGSTLYCTTFPCHICAKHIVASGIDTVFYIEPYPKSYAEQLHGDSIALDHNSDTDDKTLFKPFIGISPFRFRELFERSRRKDSEGNFVDWMDGKPKVIVRYTIANWLQNEAALFAIFQKSVELLVQDGKILSPATSPLEVQETPL